MGRRRPRHRRRVGSGPDKLGLSNDSGLCGHHIAAIVILVGAITELRQTIRQRRELLTQQEALEGLRTVFSGVILGWIGLAAICLLIPTLWHESNLSGQDALLILALLAFAGDRAHYLVVTRLPSGTRRRARLAEPAGLVIPGGWPWGPTSCQGAVSPPVRPILPQVASRSWAVHCRVRACKGSKTP